MVDTVRSAQARRQLREPESGRFKDEHKKAGFPNADALEKYERQTSVVSPPASYYDVNCGPKGWTHSKTTPPM